MTITVLAINPGHNGSTALVQDGQLLAYIEEKRLSRMKYDGNPFRGMIDFITKVPKIDVMVMGGTGQEEHRLPWTGENSYVALVRKFNPRVKTTAVWNEHHMGHVAAAFYGSGFDTAAAIIVDGSGSRCKLDWNRSEEGLEAYETESIYQCSFPGEFEPVFKRYAENHAPRVIESDREIDGTVTTVKAYEAVSMYLGFGFIEAGKTMGLAPYGKKRF